MNYSLCILAVLVSTSLFIAEAKKKPNDSTKKYEGDFEFVDEVSGMKVDEIIYFSNRKKFMAPSTTASLPTQRESCFKNFYFAFPQEDFFYRCASVGKIFMWKIIFYLSLANNFIVMQWFWHNRWEWYNSTSLIANNFSASVIKLFMSLSAYGIFNNDSHDT